MSERYTLRDTKTGLYIATWMGRLTWTLKLGKAHTYGLKRARRAAKLRPRCVVVPAQKDPGAEAPGLS